MYYPKCEQDVSALVHTCDPCNNVERGRVRSIVMVDPLGNYTMEDLKELTLEKWKEAIDKGQIILLPRVIGSFDGGSPIEGDGYGDETSRLIGYNYTLDAKDPSYASNTDFWQAAEKKTWWLAYRTETLIHFVDGAVKVQAKAPVEEGLDTDVVWNLHYMWASDSKPTAKSFEPIAELFEKGCVAKGEPA